MKSGGMKAALVAGFAAPVAAHAQDAVVNTGDTGWILTASAFVLLMTLPGLGLFYGGLVRARNVLSVFPNLQIIATTHSPFILASVPGARVYVCRWDGQRCTVSEESEAYANQPVDEILLSAAFDHTQPFGPEISELLGKRKQAIKDGDAAVRRQIEAQLVAKNPEYFSYFGVEQKLQALKEVD